VHRRSSLERRSIAVAPRLACPTVQWRAPSAARRRSRVAEHNNTVSEATRPRESSGRAPHAKRKAAAPRAVLEWHTIRPTRASPATHARGCFALDVPSRATSGHGGRSRFRCARATHSLRGSVESRVSALARKCRFRGAVFESCPGLAPGALCEGKQGAQRRSARPAASTGTCGWGRGDRHACEGTRIVFGTGKPVQ